MEVPAGMKLVLDNIYGKDLKEVKIPEGYRFSEFREPLNGESWLGYDYRVYISITGVFLGTYKDRRRIILVPDNVYGKPLDQVKIPEGWEKVDFREPAFGEYFLGPDGFAYFNGSIITSPDKRRIIVKPKPKPRRWIVEESNATFGDGQIFMYYNGGCGNTTIVKVVEEIKQ